MYRIILLLLIVLLNCSHMVADQLIVGGGDFDIIHRAGKVFEFRAEYRWDKEVLWKIRPVVGGLITTKDSKFAYAGGAVVFDFCEKYALGLSFAPGFYSRGDGKNLHHSLNFKSQAELWYKFNNGVMSGIAFSHISNGGLGKSNPGQESLIFQIAFPI